MEISTIGLDLAKSTSGSQVLPFFAEQPPCLVGMEACGTSHHWARELVKLGHEVRLMRPALPSVIGCLLAGKTTKYSCARWRLAALRALLGTRRD